MAKWRRLKSPFVDSNSSSRRAALNAGKAQASQLLDRGEAEAALAILEPLAADFQQDAELQLMIGLCYVGLDDPDTALFHCERAYGLDKQPGILFPLGLVYLQLAMFGSALYALTESIRRGVPLPDDMQDVLEQLRQDVCAMAADAGLPLDKTIAGLREMERGIRLLVAAEYGRANEATRAAIKILGDWPEPHNNLALGLFFGGHVAAAIAECRQVLARRPDNITAACNLVRFLAWSGEPGAAQEAWQQLRPRTPPDPFVDAITLAEAAAAIDDDESVRRLLQPLGNWSPEDIDDLQQYVQIQLFLAIADANLGDPRAAKRRLRKLDDDDRRVRLLGAALRQGKQGLGLTPRFAYYHGLELVPGTVAQEFAALIDAAGESNSPRAVKALKQFVARYPQLVVMAEKAIWDEDAIDFGLLTLRHVGTPAAHAALRRFAGSQAGSDEQRLNALLSLQVSGGTEPGEVFRIWRNGAWHAIQTRGFTIVPRDSRPQHKPKVAKLMEQGQAAMRAHQGAEAAALLRQAIALEPRACDALNNLAAALDMTGEREASKAVLEQALAINPTYLFARVNLALKLIDQDVDAAAALLERLAAQTSFTPEEFVFYQYGLAQVAIRRREYEAAHGLLDMALTVDPDYDPAAELLARLEEIEFRAGSGDIWHRFHERLAAQNAQYRHRQQTRLTTLAPPVAAVAGIYPVDALREIAKAIAPARRLTGLRRAGLLQLVIEALLDPATIDFVVNQRLRAGERAALAAVLNAGGAMPQQQFRAAYGDDAAESPHWQYAAPASVAGRLRLHCLLAETTVDGDVYLAVPGELRRPLQIALQA